jgi:hypothetical protein
VGQIYCMVVTCFYQCKSQQNVNKAVCIFVNSFHFNIVLFLDVGLPKNFSVPLFIGWQTTIDRQKWLLSGYLNLLLSLTIQNQKLSWKNEILYCNAIHPLWTLHHNWHKKYQRLRFPWKYEVAFFLFDIMLLFIEVNTGN